MKKAVNLILLSMCLLAVLGCSSQESKIAGKWLCKASGDSIVLQANHECAVTSMGFQYPGKWTLTDSTIKIEAGQVSMKGSFDGKNIVLEDTIMHNKYVYERVAPKT